MYLYLIPSIITLTLTFSWYSFQFLKKSDIVTFASKENFYDKKATLWTRHNVPAYMWDIYENGRKNSGILTTFDVVRGVSPQFLGSFHKNRDYRNHNNYEIRFNVPRSKVDETLLNAEVRITVKGMEKPKMIFQIYVRNKGWIFLDSKPIPGVFNWVSLNVTSSVKALRNLSGTLSFLLVVVTKSIELKSCPVSKSETILLLSYLTQSRPAGNVIRNLRKESTKLRKKRNADVEDYEEESNRIWDDEYYSEKLSKKIKRLRNTCRRKPLYIDFSEIDYDTWIVAPSGYEAFQCVGKCLFPVSEHLSPTKHAIVQTLVHNVSPRKAQRACCVPTRLEPISVLYVDSQGILTYRFNYQDMVVTECGCR